VSARYGFVVRREPQNISSRVFVSLTSAIGCERREQSMPIRAVVFDLDGTIVNFNLDYKAVRAEAIEFLTKQGFPRSIFSMNESVFEALKKMEIHMRNHGKGEKEISELREAVLSVVEQHEMEAARSTSLLPGVLDTLKTLKKMRLRLALFTVNGKKSTSYVLRALRIGRFFDKVVTRDSVSMVKPNPVHLEAALKMLRVKPEEAVVVGDSVWDVKSARELKVVAVGVPTGVSTPEELRRAGTTYLISAVDLPTLIKQLNGKPEL